MNGFEKDLKEFVNSNDNANLNLNKRVVALSAGTAAVHLGLLNCGVKPGDEVIVQSFTFCASTHPVTYLGATPVLVDSEPDTTEEEQIGIRERYLRHFKKMAQRGFYSFDRDISDLMKYHLICKPAKPLMAWQEGIIPVLNQSRLVETENTMMMLFGRRKSGER